MNEETIKKLFTEEQLKESIEFLNRLQPVLQWKLIEVDTNKNGLEAASSLASNFETAIKAMAYLTTFFNTPK